MKVGKYNPGDMLLVWWEDVLDDSNWKTPEQVEKLETAKAQSIGWFVSCKKGKLKIAHSRADEDKSCMVFPIGVVCKIDKLRTINGSRD